MHCIVKSEASHGPLTRFHVLPRVNGGGLLHGIVWVLKIHKLQLFASWWDLG